MTSGQWERIKEAFEAARAMQGAERREYLQSIAARDPEIASELRDLLKAYGESEDFLATAGMRQSIQSGLADAGFSLIGRRLGAYQVCEVVGVGGMGEVYRGERVDGEFQQRVAIKAVRATDAFSIARFRTERQILANLSHPNIARLYDGGTTERGDPYLVMEFIEGQRIDEYCRGSKLTDRERVRLFQTVCGAVQYAHEHGIIHRDLKPANIMVGQDGAPRLLDFGIAKLVEETGAGSATATHAHALTPDYASPEQLLHRPLTPASDVFSLGAILHELLSGTRFRPDPEAKNSGRSIAPEFVRIIAKATSADPAVRYASPAELSQALDRAIARPPRTRWAGAIARPPRTRWAVAIAAAAIVVLTASLLLWRGRFAAAGAGASIVVVRVENLSQDPSLDWMDRGISELLTTGLAQSAEFEVISTERIRSLIARRVKGDAKLPGSVIRDVAADAKARYFVSGALMRLGPRLRLDVKVQDTASGQVLFAHHVDGDDPQALVRMADETAGMVVGRLAGSGHKKPDSGQGLTDNVAALQAYTEGMRYRERFLNSAAIQSFQKALELDPRFAMAHYRIADTIGVWNWRACRDETQRAAGIAESLSLPRTRILQIRVLNLTCSGEYEAAVKAAQELADENPHDADAWCELARARYVSGDMDGAIAACERGYALDSKSALVMEVGWWIAAYTGDFARMMQIANQYQSTLEPGDVNGLDAIADGYSMFGRLDEAMEVYRKENRYDKMAFIDLRLGKYDEAEALLRRDIEGLPAGGAGRGGRTGFLGDTEVGRGNLDRAVPYFEEGARLYGRQMWFGADVMWKAAEVYLEQGQTGKLLELADHQSNPWRAGFRGMAESLLNRPEQADVEFAALRASISAVMGDTMANQYEQLYRGLAAVYAHKPAQAVGFLAKLPFLYRMHTALPLARAYLEQGNLAAAEKELNFAIKAQSIWGVPIWYERQNMLVLLLSHYYLGEVLEKTGRLAEATQHYREFYRHFERSSAKLPQIAAARTALSRSRR